MPCLNNIIVRLLFKRIICWIRKNLKICKSILDTRCTEVNEEKDISLSELVINIFSSGSKKINLKEQLTIVTKNLLLIGFY